MTWQMEHRFLYERLKKPRSDTDRLIRGYVEAKRIVRTSGKFTIVEGARGEHAEFSSAAFVDGFRKWQVPEEYIEHVLNQRGMFDPSFQCLSNIGEVFLRRGANSYVFAKDFWRLLQKTEFTDFRWSNLPKDLRCSLRFPEPIIDDDGDSISEINLAIIPKSESLDLRFGQKYAAAQDRGGDHVMLGWWRIDGSPAHGYTHQVFGLDDQVIKDTWNRLKVESPGVFLANFETLEESVQDQVPSFLFSVIKALVYLATGDPDLREFQNKIRYREKDKKRPIGEHKEYSELPFKVVGFNWKKEREQHTDSWGVEPFMRWQRVGPGRKDLKLTMVRERWFANIPGPGEIGTSNRWSMHHDRHPPTPTRAYESRG